MWRIGLIGLGVLAGCVHAPAIIEAPRLEPDELALLLPAKVADKEGWSRDLRIALDVNTLPADVEHACGIVAVDDQESGFQAKPAVRNLQKSARKAQEEKADDRGPRGAKFPK